MLYNFCWERHTEPIFTETVEEAGYIAMFERLRIPPYSEIEIVAQASLREEIDYDSV